VGTREELAAEVSRVWTALVHEKDNMARRESSQPALS